MTFIHPIIIGFEADFLLVEMQDSRYLLMPNNGHASDWCLENVPGTGKSKYRNLIIDKPALFGWRTMIENNGFTIETVK